MSFVRALPSLRSRASHRVWAASFSSSASTSASATNTPPAPDLFQTLTSSDTAPAPAAASTSDSVTNIQSFLDPIIPSYEGVATEDGPPVPPADSYRVNPAAAANLAQRASIGSQKPVYNVSVKATRNNTIATFANDAGRQFVTLSGGKLGFKKSNRNGYEAGYQCAVGIISAMEKELERTDFEWQLYLKGFGQGRDAILTAITTAVGTNVKTRLTRVTDRTPLKVGGTRGKKARRI
ncbi:hypothetical protein C2E23DRAFT_761029 [Lenzites betulinus]|nr:hypothetical protein C2E23DRAFT_761029 [Lenzites betulinus]